MGRYRFAILAVMAILVTLGLALVFFTARLDTDSADTFGDAPPVRRAPPVTKQAPSAGKEPAPGSGATADPARSQAGAIVTPDVLSSFRIVYGPSDNELGVIRNTESPLGPTSFSVDSGGNWYIADAVKRRIAVFATDGTFLKSIAVQGSIDDITVTDAGQVYVLDAADKIVRKYDQAGKLAGRADAGAMLGAPAGLRSSNDKAYVFSDRQYQAEVTIDRSKGRALPAASGFSELARKGKRYLIEVTDGAATLLIVPSSGSSPRTIELDIDRVASASVLRIDDSGHIYLQIERFLPDYKVGLQVLRLTPNGAVLSATDVPNNFYTWTSKMVEVDEQGNMYQAIPTKSGVRFRLWQR